MSESIHTCSYYCERPACTRRQRDELVTRLTEQEAELGRLREDAARLDWLDGHFQSGGGMDEFGLDNPDWRDSIEWSDADDPQSFRSLIDAARAATQEGEGDA